MPLIKKPTYDLLSMTSWIDIAVNPVNCMGIQGAGLALAFKEYCPEQYNSYREYCNIGKLKMGTLHTFYNEKDKTTIVNLPTKNDWRDSSNLEDVELGVIALSKYLEAYPKHTVALPMLGAGLGRLDKNDVYALFEKHLERLPNIIFVCMRPDSFQELPKYLVVGGSREYTNYTGVELGLIDACIDFNLTYKDFEAIVSGGARGVDRITCGTGLPGDTSTTIAGCHHLRSVVCHADWDRYNKTAGFIRNKTMFEIGTHFVLFIGSRSMGTRMMRDLIERHNKDVDAQSPLPQQSIDDFFNNGSNCLPKDLRVKKHLYVHDISRESL